MGRILVLDCMRCEGCDGAFDLLAEAGAHVESRDALTLEDAVSIAGIEIVIFITSVDSGRGRFQLQRIYHSPPARRANTPLTPRDVMAISQRLFKRSPQGYVLSVHAIDPADFHSHLSSAIEFLVAAIELRNEYGVLKLAPDAA